MAFFIYLIVTYFVFIEVKAASRPRLASTTNNRRPSLTQFLFGGKSSNNLCKYGNLFKSVLIKNILQ